MMESLSQSLSHLESFIRPSLPLLRFVPFIQATLSSTQLVYTEKGSVLLSHTPVSSFYDSGMESKPTSAGSTSTLRKRMKVLERAQSFSSLNEIPLPDINIKLKHSEERDRDTGRGQENEEGMVLSPSDYGDENENETHSESSWEEEEEDGSGKEGEGDDVRDEEEGDQNYRTKGTTTPPPSQKPLPASDRVKPARPVVDTSESRTYSSKGKTRRDYLSSSPMSPTTRAWYEFDLAVVVALVSPIGNWLTGGDHIKNLLLIVLLIFYLHQIIEVPWQLYQKCRPRHRPYHLSASLLNDPTSPESRYALLASSELQKLESLFLLLTFLSPLLGALLLRYATSAVLGPHAVSWFSTGLFVLATGMRPWSHLFKRISERTNDLHDFVHYPSPARDARDEEHKELKRRVGVLEGKVKGLKKKVRGVRGDLLDYVDEAMNVVEGVVKKQNRKCVECRRKVEEVEKALMLVSSGTTKKKPAVSISANATAINSSMVGDMVGAKHFLSSLMGYLTPTWLAPNTRERQPQKLAYGSKGNNNNKSTPKYSRSQSHPSNLYSLNSNSSILCSPSPTQCVTPLETIPEEDRDRMLSKTQTWYWRAGEAVFAKPLGMVMGWVVWGVGYVVGVPLRAVGRMVGGRY